MINFPDINFAQSSKKAKLKANQFTIWTDKEMKEIHCTIPKYADYKGMSNLKFGEFLGDIYIVFTNDAGVKIAIEKSTRRIEQPEMLRWVIQKMKLNFTPSKRRFVFEFDKMQEYNNDYIAKVTLVS
jgi:hypothetical protein